MVSICIFLVCKPETSLKHCPFYISLKEAIMYPSGTGFKSTNLIRCLQREQKDLRIHSGWDSNQGWFSIYLALGCNQIEPENRQILALSITKERNTFVAERFLSGLVKIHGNQPVSTDGGRTWYPQACGFLKVDHHIHSPFEKSIIERTMQHIKDRTECFDDYFPCQKENCKLKHVLNWLNLFVTYHNNEVINA